MPEPRASGKCAINFCLLQRDDRHPGQPVPHLLTTGSPPDALTAWQ
jgi:hypothetical protein